MDIKSCLRLTQPVYFTGFTVNSLPNFPLISTPPRLGPVCSAQKPFPDAEVPLAGRWDDVSSKLLTKYPRASPLPKPALPGGCLRGLLGQGTCFPADQTKKIKAASGSALIIHCCSGAVKRYVSQTWSLSGGAGSVAPAEWRQSLSVTKQSVRKQGRLCFCHLV